MYYDIESEFWKEHFVHLLHKNMVRTNAEKIEFKNIKFQFDDFERKYPELKPQVDFAENYCTWEIFVTPKIKLRLFIPNCSRFKTPVFVCIKNFSNYAERFFDFAECCLLKGKNNGYRQCF